jgi:CDP-glycerol glycerophosphotransferase
MLNNALGPREWIANWLRGLAILWLLRPFFLIAGLFVRRVPGRMLFINGEKSFADNLAIFFRHSLTAGEDCWLLNRHAGASGLDSVPTDRLVTFHSLRGLCVFLSAPTVVIFHGIRHKYYFPYFLDRRRRLVVNLWHGVPLKRLNFQVVGWDTRDNRKQILKPSKFVVCSDIERLMIAACYRMSLDDIWVTNTPRNDALIAGVREGDADTVRKHPFLAGKVVLYAPTWRESGQPTHYFPFPDLDWDRLEALLARNDATMLVRGHSMHGPAATPIPFSQRIRRADQSEFPNVDRLLVHADVLVTDYSSIAFDFLLTGRPMVFVPYDVEGYARYRGFMVDYEDFSPGPKVTTQAGFEAALDSYLSDPSEYAAERERLAALMHRHRDGRACDRLLALIRSEAGAQSVTSSNTNA